MRTTQEKFPPGTRVRIVSNGDRGCPDMLVGEVGVVVNPDAFTSCSAYILLDDKEVTPKDFACYPYIAIYDGGYVIERVEEEEKQPPKEEKLPQGTRVRIVSSGYDSLLGKEGTIVFFTEGTTFPKPRTPLPTKQSYVLLDNVDDVPRRTGYYPYMSCDILGVVSTISNCTVEEIKQPPPSREQCDQWEEQLEHDSDNYYTLGNIVMKAPRQYAEPAWNLLKELVKLPSTVLCSIIKSAQEPYKSRAWKLLDLVGAGKGNSNLCWIMGECDEVYADLAYEEMLLRYPTEETIAAVINNFPEKYQEMAKRTLGKKSEQQCAANLQCIVYGANSQVMGKGWIKLMEQGASDEDLHYLSKYAPKGYALIAQKMLDERKEVNRQIAVVEKGETNASKTSTIQMGANTIKRPF